MLLDSYISKNIEKYGTGFKRIKDWFKSYPNLKYQENNMKDFVQVTIESISKKINDTVNKRMKKILKLLQTNKKTTIKALSNELNVSEITMKRDMKRLVKKGFLVRVGSDKNSLKNRGGYIHNKKLESLNLNYEKNIYYRS